MPRQALAEGMMQMLAGRPEVTRVYKEQVSCGRCKKRVKIVRHPPTKITFSVTEPDYPRYEIAVETKNSTETVVWMEQHLRRQGVEVINR